MVDDALHFVGTRFLGLEFVPMLFAKAVHPVHPGETEATTLIGDLYFPLFFPQFVEQS